MKKQTISRIFVSYRREDSQWFSVLLHHELASAFGEENVFLDTPNILWGSYIRGSEVHEVGEVDVGVVAMTTLSRWIPNLTDRSTLNRIQ